MFKIKTLNKIADAGPSLLLENGCEVGPDLENPDAILVRSADMKDYVFNPELKCIARAGAGTNNIPVGRCSSAGIAVFNTPGANAEAVKELAVCAMLLCSRDVEGGIQWVRSIAGEGDAIPAMVEKGKSAFTGPELAGKTLGVIGLGAVGAPIANAALGLGMQVYGFDPYLSVDAAWMLSSQVKHAVDLDTLYQASEFVTIHVPYLESTHHMINNASIAKMKTGVRIINLARAELVDDDDMIEAIDAAKVARYVTDFPNGKTACIPNILPMPHLGASTPESEEKCAEMEAREILDYISDGNVKNSVNFPSASLGRTGPSRLCVFHRNIPRMLNACLDLIGKQNINVENLINTARGENAYTMIDAGSKVDPDLARSIAYLDGIIRVRLI
jgi:D-3-phosphoglycerate dehydrogenase